MNPLLKYLLKQVEENYVVLEKYAKSSEWSWSRYENKIHVEDAFGSLHSALSTVKDIIQELM